MTNEGQIKTAEVFSDQQSLDGHLHRLNLRLELRAFLDGDGGGDDWPGHPARAPQGLLGAHKHVRDVLVLTQQRQMKDDLQRFSIGSHHDELRNATVQGFSGWNKSTKKCLASQTSDLSALIICSMFSYLHWPLFSAVCNWPLVAPGPGWFWWE